MKRQFLLSAIKAESGGGTNNGLRRRSAEGWLVRLTLLMHGRTSMCIYLVLESHIKDLNPRKSIGKICCPTKLQLYDFNKVTH